MEFDDTYHRRLITLPMKFKITLLGDKVVSVTLYISVKDLRRQVENLTEAIQAMRTQCDYVKDEQCSREPSILPQEVYMYIGDIVMCYYLQQPIHCIYSVIAKAREFQTS